MASQLLSLRQRCARFLSFRPSLEGREPRCLMAADAAMTPLHNSFDPEDVNDDGPLRRRPGKANGTPPWIR